MKQKIPTPRQEKAAKALLNNLVKDNPASFGAVLKSVGYGVGLQTNPKRVLSSSGFKAALTKLGLTEDLITTSLVADIKLKPQNRIQELKLGAEVLGMVKRDEPEEKVKQITTYNFIFNEKTQEEIKKVNEIIKEKLLNATNKET